MQSAEMLAAYGLPSGTVCKRAQKAPEQEEGDQVECFASIALEVAYLVLDTLGMLLARKVARGPVNPVKMLHHLAFGAYLLFYTWQAMNNREFGAFIVVSFLVSRSVQYLSRASQPLIIGAQLMNASTPLLNLRLAVKRYAVANPEHFYSDPRHVLAQKALDWLLIAAFACARPLLVCWILHSYGARSGVNGWQMFCSVSI